MITEKTIALKLVTDRRTTAHGIEETASYFPYSTRARSDGETLFILNPHGEVDYTRRMATIREITVTDIHYNNHRPKEWDPKWNAVNGGAKPNYGTDPTWPRRKGEPENSWE